VTERTQTKIVQDERRLWFLRLARIYVRRRLTRGFDGVFVQGLQALRAVCEAGPVIVAANHVTWWDVFVLVLLDQALGTQSYCYMDDRKLNRMRFFRWIGAIPLRPNDPEKTVQDLESGVELLNDKKRAVWIFPQGRQRPFHIRPLDMRPGIAFVAQRSRVPVVPLSISYLYADSPRQRIITCFGTPIKPPGSWRDFMQALEKEIVAGLALNDQFLLSGEPEYEMVLAPHHASGDTTKGSRVLSLLIRGPKAEVASKPRTTRGFKS